MTRSSGKTIALTLTGIIAAALLFSWQIFPRILQEQAEKYIEQKTAHHLTMARPEFNPFKLSLRLSDVRLTDSAVTTPNNEICPIRSPSSQSSTEGGGGKRIACANLTLTEPNSKPLLAFRELIIDLSASSVYSNALIFDAIRLDGLQIDAVLHSNGKLNWQALLSKLQNPAEKPSDKSQTLPGFLINDFVLSGMKLNFTDQRMNPAFTAKITPVDLTLTNLSSLPKNQGQYSLSAQTSFGTQVVWQGNASLVPLQATGNVKITRVNLATFTSYLKDALPVRLHGLTDLSANYRLSDTTGKLDLQLDHITAKLTGLEVNTSAKSLATIATIDAKDGSFNLLKNRFTLGTLRLSNSQLALQSGKTAFTLGNLNLDELDVDLTKHLATTRKITLSDGYIHINRNNRGEIDFLLAMKQISPPSNDSGKKNTSKTKVTPWHYQLNKFALTGFETLYTDASANTQFGMKNMALEVENISDDWQISLPVNLTFQSRDGGNFTMDGQVIPAKPAIDLNLKLVDLNLKPVQPFLSKIVKLKLLNGRLSTSGHASYNAQHTNFKGNFALNDLRLIEAANGTPFLSLKSLGSRAFTATDSKLDMTELKLVGLDTKLMINKDKTLSYKNIMMPPSKEASVKSTAPYSVNIDRLRLSRGALDFSDYSLALPFGTRIHDLNGVISGLSTKPDAQGQLALAGQVDDYGTAQAAGKIVLMNPADMTDIKVVFKNIEMTRLTPYSATFAGRRITSGKLSLDLEYKIQQHQLLGENRIIMNQLTLGEKVASVEAKNLPLDLAIAILQDTDGKIELNLPVSGSLDDPKFSLGGIVWKAIVNVIGKIITAPFRALGALFGSDRKFENILFAAGKSQLSPPEREKIMQLAKVMQKRPALTLSIPGVYADVDRVAIEDLRLRLQLATMTGSPLEKDEEPDPLNTHLVKVQSALEKLFATRMGSGELAALKAGYQLANPGKLKENTASKLLSGLSGMFRDKRLLNDKEVAQLKGTDFYLVLFERLRDKLPVDEGELLALATARRDTTIMALKNEGMATERLLELKPEKITSEEQGVPVKLELGSK
jgi:hypothetical protein